MRAKTTVIYHLAREHQEQAATTQTYKRTNESLITCWILPSPPKKPTPNFLSDMHGWHLDLKPSLSVSKDRHFHLLIFVTVQCL